MVEKPKIGGIEGQKTDDESLSDSDLIKDFAGHTIALQSKFMEIVDENLRLKKENQKLRNEQQQIREILR